MLVATDASGTWNIVAARGIFQQMNPRELQVVFQEINQRLNFQRQGGFVPERFGSGSV